MEINDEMDGPDVIDPYDVEEGELPPPPAESNTSSDTEPEDEVEVKDQSEATVGTITRAPYHVYPFSSKTYVGSGPSHKVYAPEYSTLKRLSETDRYLGELDTDLRGETRERYELQQSMSTLEDQMRGLMLKIREEKKTLKKKLKVAQEEKKRANGDVTTPNDAQPSEPRESPRDSQIMPPKAMSQATIERLITQRVNAALEDEQASQVTIGRQGRNANGSGGQGRALVVRECNFVEFIRCNPTVFHENKGAIELSRWTCLDVVEVATRGIEAANWISWTKMKRLMTKEFCPIEEIQRMEHEL
nr:hypothetical protein [Tanacetum cinerariifolium]